MSTPRISRYLAPVSFTERALAKRRPLPYSDTPQIRALLAKPSWSVRQQLLPPKHIRDRPPRPNPLEGRLQQITESARSPQPSPQSPPPQSPAHQPTTDVDEIEADKEEADEEREREEETTAISVETLRHLLRLSALPPPAEDSAAERRMLGDLRSQIHFVRQMQRVDVDGVEPLVAIRDESAAAVDEARVGLADEEIQAALAAEEVVGRGSEFERMRRRKKKKEEEEWTDDDNDRQQQRMEWDPFELGVGSEGASSSSGGGRRAGRWFVVKKRGRSKGEKQRQQQQQQKG